MSFFPENIYYMITTECNQRCTKCSHWKNKDETDRLDTKKIINAVLGAPSIKELCIVGGEPLLFKDEITDILKGTASTGVRTTIITNGVELDSSFLKSVSGFNVHFVVSIDTIDRKMWKFVRGGDSFDLVINNLDNAVSLLRPEQLSIQSVLAKETEPFIEAVSEFAENRNIYHSIQSYISEGFNGFWTPLDDQSEPVNMDKIRCFAAGRNISIMQSGDVYTCFQQSWIKGCHAPIGNLKTGNIKQMIQSEYTDFVIQKMKECNLSCKVLKCNCES
ncbi:MAG TPA: radical SAM protein [bacterium]|nr:radical SAM protein [bacterium]